MKATVDANDLIEKLTPLSIIASSSFTIASKLKLQFTPTHLNIKASDYNVMFSTDISITDIEDLDDTVTPVLVNTKKFIAFIKRMGKNKTIRISMQKRLTLSSGKAKIQLSYSNSKPFPQFKYDETEAIDGVLSSKDIIESINNVAFAAASDDMDLQPISHIYLDFSKGKIIATDSIIIASSKLPEYTGGYLDTILIGSKDMELIKRSILAFDTETVRLFITPSSIKFEGKNSWVGVLRHNKQFPVILAEMTSKTKNDFPLQIRLDKQELSNLLSTGLSYDALKNIIILSINKSGQCMGIIKDEQDEITFEFTKKPVMGTGQATDIDLTLDTVRFRRLVEHIKTDTIEISITSNKEPVYFIYDNQVYIQAPIWTNK